MRLAFLLLITSLVVRAQQGYDVKFQVENFADSTVYLGYYFGDNTYVKDTARAGSDGRFTFSGAKQLPEGIYLLIVNRTNQLEFVIGRDQHFVVKSKGPEYVNNITIVGDDDNSIFFQNLKERSVLFKEADQHSKLLRDSTASEDAKNKARVALEAINETINTKQNQIIERHPDYVTARIMKAHKPLTLPEPPKNKDGFIDSTFQLRWYREHYFDNINLADDAILRLPRSFYKNKIYEYLDRLFVQHPDSLTRAVEFVIGKAKPNPETYKYAVTVCAMKYQLPEFMGLDEVFVNIHDKYFATGEMNYWANASMLKNMKEAADRIRRSMIGRTGDNLIMLDADLKPQSMHHINKKYTILYVFDPDCGFCRQETPKLVDFYKNTKFDVEVYAVDTDSSLLEMKKYIREMGMKWITVNAWRSYVGDYRNHYDALQTPTLYVLDERKKIIGKKVPIEKLEEFLTHHERIETLRRQKKL